MCSAQLACQANIRASTLSGKATFAGTADSLVHVHQSCIGMQGRTALSNAAEWGRVESVRVLLQHGADPNTTDNNVCVDANSWLLCNVLHSITALASKVEALPYTKSEANWSVWEWGQWHPQRGQ